MREIKFRAWDGEVKKMWSWRELCNTHFCSSLYSHGDGSWEVMQYTGLHSKNQIELYEKDIIILDYVVKEHARCVICYDSKQARYKAVPIVAYKLNAGNGGWTGFELFTNCEVIGNIYENPELIQS